MTSLSSRLKTFERNISDARAARQEAADAEAEQREQQATREAAEVKALVLDYIELLRERGLAPLDHYVSAGDPADHYEYAGQVWPAFMLSFKEVKYDADNRPTDHQEQILLSSAGTILHGQGRSSTRYPRSKDDVEYPAAPGIEAAFDLDEYPPRQALAMLTARLPTTKEKDYDEQNLGEDFRTHVFRNITSPDRPIDRVRAAAQYELDRLDQAQQTELTAQRKADDKQRQDAEEAWRRQTRLDNLVQGLNLPLVAARLEVEIANGANFAATNTALRLHDRRDACTGYCEEETAVRRKLAEIERTHPAIELRLAETDEEGRFHVVATRR